MSFEPFYKKGSNEFLDTYLEYVEQTESPRQFHIWSALAGVSACLGRRCFMQFGMRQIFPNMYVTLVGPPGSRKSSAISDITARLKAATGVRFAPTDTAGQRQGLIAEMMSLEDEDEDVEKQLAAALATSIEALGDVNLAAVDPRDRHVLFAACSELTSFIGNNTIDMLTFLGTVWDGESYTYKIRKEKNVLRDPLMTVLAASTPTSIAGALPQEAVGQGFMSRLILVHGMYRYQDLAWPEAPDAKLVTQIEKKYNRLYHDFSGEIEFSAEARDMLTELYTGNVVDIPDTRFTQYIDRRHTHLLKLCMVIAASNLRRVVFPEDVAIAHKLLAATELLMPDALGEYGLSPIATAKQRMLEFIQAANVPVSIKILGAIMAKDMRQIDFLNSLNELANANKIMQISTRDGVAFVAKNPLKAGLEDLADILGGDIADGTLG
jgi:hypothetical protein